MKKGDEVLHLSPLQMKLLILLTTTPGVVVPYEVIDQELWGETTTDLSGNRSFQLSNLRGVLGESADKRLLIRTVSKRGLVFVAPVTSSEQRTEEQAEAPSASPIMGVADSSPEEISAGSAFAPAAPPAAAFEGQPQPSRKLLMRAIGAVATIVLLALISYFAVRPARPKLYSIAILPALNLTQSSSNQSVADSIADSLANQLSLLAGRHLRVVTAAPADLLEEQHMDAQQAGTRLHVDYVLRSTIQKAAASSLNLTLQLVRSADDSVVWTRWFNGNDADILEASRALAAEVLGELPLGLKPAANPQTYISPMPAAETAYENGKRALRVRSQESLNGALDDFKIATGLDRNFADAFAQLGITYCLLGQYAWMPQPEAVQKGDQAIDEALTLNANLPSGLAARGFSRWFYRWDWEQAELDLRKSSTLDASDANSLHWYSLVLATAGHAGEAAQAMESALAIEPHSPILRLNRGWLDYFDHQLDAAARRMEAVIHDEPYFYGARLKLWAVYSLQQRYQDAFIQLNYMSLDRMPADYREKLSRKFKSEGYQSALRDWSSQTANVSDANSIFRAQCAQLSGNRDQAVSIIIDGIRQHDGWMVFVLSDPVLKPLLKDQRLIPLLDKLEKARTF